jgi:hypothetical protein
LRHAPDKNYTFTQIIQHASELYDLWITWFGDHNAIDLSLQQKEEPVKIVVHAAL